VGEWEKGRRGEGEKGRRGEGEKGRIVEWLRRENHIRKVRGGVF
jgi:hypothetical protein